MTGFFYLESLTNNKHHHEEHSDRGGVFEDSSSGSHLFLHRPPVTSPTDHEIYAAANKGFDLWPAHALGLGLSNGNGGVDRRIVQGSYGDLAARSGALVMSSSGTGGGVNCQDCGNQAKKNCTHMRCRTCCKSRGFHCQTHVKSTWVPAAKRHEHQQQIAELQPQQQQQQQFRLENPKRQREISQPGTSHGCTTRAGFEVEHFPAEVSLPAVFRCVRVSSTDDVAGNEYAYQTSIAIRGHIFKGVLYDRGPDPSSSSGGGGGLGIQHLGHLTVGGRASLSASTAATGMLDPSLYPSPLNAFMASTQFFPQPKS